MSLGTTTSFFVIFVLASRLSAINFHHKCSTKIHFPATNINTAESVSSSIVQRPLHKGQTLCFDVTNEGSRKQYAFISLLDIKEEYEIKTAYSFSIPIMHAACICECPGSIDYCNPSHEKESCRKNYVMGTGDCTKKYSTGNNDCPRHSKSEVCCNISVYTKESTPQYTAVYFGHPIYRYIFETGFAYNQRETVRHTHKVKVTSLDGELITNIGVVRAFPDPKATPRFHSRAWHFVRHSDSTLLTSDLINDVDETNVNNLGWYKFNSTGQLLPLNWDGIRQSFTHQVIDCRRDRVSWNSSAFLYTKEGAHHKVVGKAVKDFFNTHLHIDRTSGRVSLNVTHSSVVLIDMKIEPRANFRSRNSTFEKMTAVIRLGHFVTPRLLLGLYAASGLFYVKVDYTNTSCEYALLVSSLKPIVQKTILLPSNAVCAIKVCVCTGSPHFCDCVNASCEEEYNEVEHWYAETTNDKPSEVTVDTKRKVTGKKALEVTYGKPVVITEETPAGVLQENHLQEKPVNVTRQIPKDRPKSLNSVTSIVIGIGIASLCVIFIIVFLNNMKSIGYRKPFRKKTNSMTPCITSRPSSENYNQASRLPLSPTENTENQESVESHTYAEVDYSSMNELRLIKNHLRTTNPGPRLIPVRTVQRYPQDIDCSEYLIPHQYHAQTLYEDVASPEYIKMKK